MAEKGREEWIFKKNQHGRMKTGRSFVPLYKVSLRSRAPGSKTLNLADRVRQVTGAMIAEFVLAVLDSLSILRQAAAVYSQRDALFQHLAYWNNLTAVSNHNLLTLSQLHTSREPVITVLGTSLAYFHPVLNYFL